jgi:hypothetical protein
MFNLHKKSLTKWPILLLCCMAIIICKRMGMGWLKSYPNNCTWIIVSCILTSCEKWQNILSCFILLKKFWISAFSCCSEIQCSGCFFLLSLNKAKHWPTWVAVPGSLHSEKQKLTTSKWKESMLWQEVKTAHNTRTFCNTFVRVLNLCRSGDFRLKWQQLILS